jgi:hypothetical protein
MTITNNAKGLISIIAYEVRLADKRVAGGHIKQGDVAGCIYERLMAKAKSNVDLKTFLTTMAHIPKAEDESDDVEWAEDRREPASHVARKGTAEPEPLTGSSSAIENDLRAWPTPGERIC